MLIDAAERKTEDIDITQYGEAIATPPNPFQERVDTAESLFGILPQNTTFEEVKDERLREG